MADDDSAYLKKSILQLSDGAISCGVLVALGVVGGSWVDGKLHSAPWFTLGLCLIGGGLGLARLIHKALDIVHDQSAAPGGARISTDQSKVGESGSGSGSGSINPEAGPVQRKAYE